MNRLIKSSLAIISLISVLLTSCQSQQIDIDVVQVSSNVSTSSNDDIKSDNVTSESLEFVSQMSLGWNLGDTLDVCNADRNGDGILDESSSTVDETLWGNPKATQQLFQSLKDDGINSVRIPVTWRDHLDENYNIDETWLDRVQEVVDYAYNLDMFIIINIHHDGGGDQNFGAWIRNASTNKDEIIEKYKIVWQQIADRFQDYSENLIFESMNEVGFDDLPQVQAYSLLAEFNQAFVDLVRSSGGNNPNRYLLIAGYWTDINMTISDYFTMPNDVANRCIVSVHYYTPWEFCTTDINKTWGTESEIQLMETQVNKLVDRFINCGVPVIVGEYGVGYGTEKDSQILFCETFVKLCHDNGIPTFFWDNGNQLDRNSYEWRTPELLDALQNAIK
ncbi:MAG: glycoside hydrolase family 5 protein [Oscillospiraceae bacterium]